MKEVLYFTAPWCGPCKALGPIMQELTSEIDIRKIDVDLNTTDAANFNVRNVPTLILTRNGQEVARRAGLASKEDILNWYNSN